MFQNAPNVVPPNFKQALGVWGNLPQLHRQQLLRLLSHLLERQLGSNRLPDKDERDERYTSVSKSDFTASDFVHPEKLQAWHRERLAVVYVHM